MASNSNAAMGVHGQCTTPQCLRKARYSADKAHVGIQAQFCHVHKTAATPFDTTNRLCKFTTCPRRATFAPTLGMRAQWCVAHRSQVCQDVRSKRCEADDCTSLAWFRLPDRKRQWCSAHAPSSAVRDVRHRCRYCGSRTAASRTGGQRCPCRAAVVAAPFWPVHLDRVMELFVVGYVRSHSVLPRNTWVTHNQALRHCRKRPDLLLALPHFALVLEVDEQQHCKGGYKNETARMREIQTALGRATVFLRFNPHAYVPCSRDAPQVDLAARLVVLVALTQRLLWQAAQHAHLQALLRLPRLQVVHLYFDGAAPPTPGAATPCVPPPPAP